MDLIRGKLGIGSARIGWKLGFGKGCGSGEVTWISADDMPFFTPVDNGGIWQNEAGLTVKVEYAETDGIVLGSFSFSGNDGINDPVEEVHFPCAEITSNLAGRSVAASSVRPSKEMLVNLTLPP